MAGPESALAGRRAWRAYDRLAPVTERNNQDGWNPNLASWRCHGRAASGFQQRPTYLQLDLDLVGLFLMMRSVTHGCRVNAAWLPERREF